MVNIITPGHEPRPCKPVRKWHCTRCDCVWETNEYDKHSGGMGHGTVYELNCPHCGRHIVYIPQRD